MPPLSHVNSCTPTNFIHNSPIPFADAVTVPALYRVLTFQVPNPTSLFSLPKLYRSVNPGPKQAFMILNKTSFYGEQLTTHSTPKLDNHLSALKNCLFPISAAILHIGDRLWPCMAYCIIGDVAVHCD